MNTFETYLPTLRPLTNGILLVYLKSQALHLVVVTKSGELYRRVVGDIDEFRETYGYAFYDQFSVTFLNALKDLRLQLLPQTATILVTLANRESIIVLEAIDRTNYVEIIGSLGVPNTIPKIPVIVPMGPPPALPKRTPKRKPNDSVLQYRRKRKK